MAGPGTELTKLLSYFTRKPSGCSCVAHAKQMDAWGPDKCEEERETILCWLEVEARKKKIPYFRYLANIALTKAIANSRK